MTKKNTRRDDLPSLENLTMDWEYEPENVLGKRAWIRIEKTELKSLLATESIPVKIVTKNFDKTGPLIDISVGGLSVLLYTKLTEGQLAKVGFFLGRQKIISKTVVRSVCSIKEKYRIGMEFVDLAQEETSFIAGLISSKVYKI